MSDVIIVALITGIPTLLVTIGGGLGWAVNLLMAQSKETITTLREERDYWRREALECRGTDPHTEGDTP